MARVPRNYTNNETATWIFFGTITRLKPYLTPDEFLVLMFIYDRTVRYGKRQENIPNRHFMEGIIDYNGRCVATRVGLSKTNLKIAIDHLFHKGIIFTDRNEYGGSNFYSINDIMEIDIIAIREYVTTIQASELSRGLVVNIETNDPISSLTREELNSRYQAPPTERAPRNRRSY